MYLLKLKWNKKKSLITFYRPSNSDNMFIFFAYQQPFFYIINFIFKYNYFRMSNQLYSDDELDQTHSQEI
jgi:hypothetical protein